MRRVIFSTTTILLVCLVFTLNFNLSAALAGNEGEKAYCGESSGNPCPPDPPKAISTYRSNEGYAGPTIRQLIVEGGGYMMKSSSYINVFFNKVELSELYSTGPDYKGLERTINAAIYYMEKARGTYCQLSTLAALTPYNQEVIYRLINLDYDTFQWEHGLFPHVFAKVKDFLSGGDVTGVFNEFYSYAGQLLVLMYTLRKEIDAGNFPNLSTVWKVNQTYSEFKLFGQYTAQVFYSIK